MDLFSNYNTRQAPGTMQISPFLKVMSAVREMRRRIVECIVANGRFVEGKL